uniref:Nuclear Testis protein N-terminal domain-containing protein n=1 Tax=Otolemur garnettii TaxID=30611 RepID=H0WK31_OTOGA
SFVSTASSVLRPDMILNPDASMPPFTALPFHPPGPSPALGPPRGQQPPPLMTAVFPLGSPFLLSTLPRTPLVAGDGTCGPSGAGAFSVILQVRSEGELVQAPPNKTFVLPQAPLNWSAPGAFCTGAQGQAPLLLSAPPVETIMPAPIIGSAPIVGGISASVGGWITGLPRPVPSPATHLAPVVSPVNTGLQPHGMCREGSLPTSQAKALQDDSCNPKSVYENYRRWQHFKSLARRHFPQNPDTEAFSCFLIPVLRTLARLKPTMTLDEGLWRAVQEWQQKNNFDRMIFYEMAEKFMEFEAEEEMQLQQLQWMRGSQSLPPPTPPRPDPQEQPGTKVVQHPVPALPSVVSGHAVAPATPSFFFPTSVVLPKKADTKAQPIHLPPPTPQQWPPEIKAPKEIPPEAVREYIDIMDKLLGPPCGDLGKPDAQLEEGEADQSQDEFGIYPDPGLLSYIDKLCSQKDFITKVEAVIHPRFLEELLSPETNMDSLALTQELEQEERLTLDQLVEKRLLALKEEQSVGVTLSRRALQMESSPSKLAAGQGAERDSHGPKLGVGAETCPAQMASRAQGHSRMQADLLRPKARGLLSGHPESPRLRATLPTSPFQGLKPTSLGLGTRDALGLQGASPVRETFGPGDGSSEDEEELPSLTFLLASQNRLLPWGLSQSPVPVQPPSAQRRGLSSATLPVAKCNKRVLSGDQFHAEKMASPGPELGASGGEPLALGPGRSSQPQKRKGDSFVSGMKKKQRCSQ